MKFTILTALRVQFGGVKCIPLCERPHRPAPAPFVLQSRDSAPWSTGARSPCPAQTWAPHLLPVLWVWLP